MKKRHGEMKAGDRSRLCLNFCTGLEGVERS